MEEKSNSTYQIPEKKINYERSMNALTKRFITGLSYRHYILAGNSVANMIEEKSLRDLDFWVTTSNADDFITIFQEFIFCLRCFDSETVFHIYPSMIEIIVQPKTEEFPTINLIHSAQSDIVTISSFDFDYCRCFYTFPQGIVARKDCMLSIFSKTIQNEISYGDIRGNRILKALKYGYTFNRKFWYYHRRTLRESTEVAQQLTKCKLCEAMRNYLEDYYWKCGPDPWHGCTHSLWWQTPYQVKVADLDMKYFETKFMEFQEKFSPEMDEDEIALKMCNLFGVCYGSSTDLSLPRLYSTSDPAHVEKFIRNIIVFNPTRAGNYLTFHGAIELVTHGWEKIPNEKTYNQTMTNWLSKFLSLPKVLCNIIVQYGWEEN